MGCAVLVGFPYDACSFRSGPGPGEVTYRVATCRCGVNEPRDCVESVGRNEQGLEGEFHRSDGEQLRLMLCFPYYSRSGPI